MSLGLIHTAGAHQKFCVRTIGISYAVAYKIGPCIIAGCSSHLCILPLNEKRNLLLEILRLAFRHEDYIYVIF